METSRETGKLNGSNKLTTQYCLPSERLLEGKLQFGDSNPGSQLEELPSWFNLELARKGQKFARERLYGVFYAHLIALFYLLAQRDARKILYYTQKSHTPELALKRYLATLLQVKLWYDSDISDDLSCPFFTSLSTVRKIHHGMGQRVQAQHPDFSKPVIEEPTEDDEDSSQPRGKLWEAFKADLESSDLAQDILPLEENPSGFYYFSQYDMTSTQWSFVALPIMYSQKLGMYDVTDEELEGFVHLWAIISHTLGLEPHYNICLVPDLESFKAHANWIYENQYLPGFFDVNYESEVMWCALAEGVSHIFPFLNVENLLLQTLEDFIVAPSQNFRRKIGWITVYRRLFQKAIVEPLLNFKWFQQYCNNYVRETIAKVTESRMGLNSSNDVEISQRAYYY